MNKKSEVVAILGASDNPERYSYKAFQMLKEYGHTPILIHPNLKAIDGLPVTASLSLAATQNPKIDTLTLYVNPQILASHHEAILKMKPLRVIFNPGTEDIHFAEELKNQGIEAVFACTLVMLRTNQF